MSDLEKGQEPNEQTEAQEVGNQMKTLVAWFAIAAVGAVLIALCVLVLFLIGVF
jgi:hypothetical protein